jgi:hypothetical protein
MSVRFGILARLEGGLRALTGRSADAGLWTIFVNRIGAGYRGKGRWGKGIASGFNS